MPQYLAHYTIHGKEPDPEGMYLTGKSVSRELKFEAPNDVEALRIALQRRMDFTSATDFVEKPYDKSIILNRLLEVRVVPLDTKIPKKVPSWDKTELAYIAVLESP